MALRRERETKSPPFARCRNSSTNDVGQIGNKGFKVADDRLMWAVVFGFSVTSRS